MITKINGIVISSGYGAKEAFRNGAAHTGIDIPLEPNTVLQSIADGVVTKVFDGSTAIGKGVEITTEAGRTHIFGHMNTVTVKTGQEIGVNDVIGFSGNTGFSTGPHLHFAERNVYGSFTDPTHLTDELAKMLDHGPGFWATAMDKYNAFADKVIMQEYGILLKPLLGLLRELFTDLGHWFIVNLPDIMGYTTIGAGVFIVLGAMIGKGGIMKPIGYWAALMILAICILGGV